MREMIITVRNKHNFFVHMDKNKKQHTLKYFQKVNQDPNIVLQSRNLAFVLMVFQFFFSFYQKHHQYNEF